MIENTDAKVFAMIEDLSSGALSALLDGWLSALGTMRDRVRYSYESGEIPAEEIIAAWNDDTWNGKE